VEAILLFARRESLGANSDLTPLNAGSTQSGIPNYRLPTLSLSGAISDPVLDRGGSGEPARSVTLMLC
jgi:hypothetical protein